LFLKNVINRLLLLTTKKLALCCSKFHSSPIVLDQCSFIWKLLAGSVSTLLAANALLDSHSVVNPLFVLADVGKHSKLESVGVPGLAVLEEGDVRHLVVLVQHNADVVADGETLGLPILVDGALAVHDVRLDTVPDIFADIDELLPLPFAFPENLLVGDGAGPGRGEGHRPVEHEQCVQGGQFVVFFSKEKTASESLTDRDVALDTELLDLLPGERLLLGHRHPNNKHNQQQPKHYIARGNDPV